MYSEYNVIDKFLRFLKILFNFIKMIIQTLHFFRILLKFLYRLHFRLQISFW